MPISSIENLFAKKKGTSDTTGSAEEKLSEKMKLMKIKDFERVVASKASSMNLPYLFLQGFPIGPDTIAIIPQDQALSLKIVAFFRSTEEIRIGVVDPSVQGLSEMVEYLKERYHIERLIIYLISEHSFFEAIKLYKAVPKIKKILKGVEISAKEIEKYKKEIHVLSDLQKIIKNVSITDIVTALISLAMQVRASDVHVEAEAEDVKIRYRIDGILNDAAVLPQELWARITSRIKLLSGLKLNVTTKPQDGRFTIFLSEDKIDVRVSVIPTTHGESIVLRLLRSSAAGLDFHDLGITGRAFTDISEELSKPNGMIITTGPTGSGKTTTLYSMLTNLNTPETKIITLEDPVEYKLEGINQSQIDYSKDYDFANGLRSILRQDPDVIMVGEIRDLETADVAINAALTGHLVLSTLHTNSAAGAIPRFLSMGVKPYLLSPALNAIIGQRLVRKVCPHCKVEDDLDTKTRAEVIKNLEKLPPESAAHIDMKELLTAKFYKGAGCKECHGIGYQGRIGIYEVMIMNKEIEAAILNQQISEYKFQDISTARGMITMIQDGLLKALEGITTVDEVFRVAKVIG